MNDVFPAIFIISIKYAENTLFPRKYPYISYREKNDRNQPGFQPFVSTCIVINNNVFQVDFCGLFYNVDRHTVLNKTQS